MSRYLRHTAQFIALVGLLVCGSLAHALTINVSLNPDRVRPNEGLRASLTVTNDSGVAVSGVELRATVPSTGVNTFNQSYLSGGGTCTFTEGTTNCYANERVTWNLGTIPAGGGVTVTMAMVVTNATPAGTVITLPAVVLVNGSQNQTTSKSVTVNGTNALTLGLDDDKDAVAPGDTLTYTLTYGNRSTSNVTGTTLSLPLPPGVTFVSASGGGTLVSNNVQWTIGTLLAGQSARQQVIVTVGNGLASGTALPIDAAVLSGTSAVTGAELARATAVTRVQTDPGLGLAIEMNPDPVRSNEGLRTAFTVTNRSGTILTGTTLRVRVPTDNINLFNQSYLSGGGTCVTSEGTTNCYADEIVTWNIGTLAAGQGVTVTMPMVVSNGTASGELIVLDAEVIADGVSQTLAGHTVAVDNDNALTLGLDEDKDAVAPGDTLTYTLTYGNRSTSNVTGTTLVFPIPEGVTLVGSSGGIAGSGFVTWNLGTLLPGTGGRRTVSVMVPATPPSSLHLSVDAAVLAGTSAVTGTELARVTDVTRIIAGNPIKLSVSLAPNPIAPNQTLTATLHVTNTASTSLTGVNLRARVPTDNINLFNQSVLSSGGTCVFSEGTTNCYVNEIVTWNLGTLAAGQSVSVTMPMVVSSGTSSGKLIVLAAEVGSDAGDQTTASNTALVGVGLYVDTDGDGIADIFDNCINVANPDQRDTDGDGYGNRCDADLNQSNFVNAADLATFKLRFGTNNPDADLDGNGFVNAADLAIFKSLFGKAPGPSGIAP
jgi:uncharacterized repeat protein (TIGR01451 family)